MIKLDEKYFISSDSYGYTLEKKKVSVRSEDKEGEWEKGDEYDNSDKVGHSSTVYGIIKLYLKELTLKRVSNTDLEDFKIFLRWYKKLKTEIKTKFDL